MNVDDIKLKFAKYRISKFELIIPGRERPYVMDPAHIGNFTIEKDFDNYYFPYMEFRIMLPDKIYGEVLRNSENVYVNLKIEYGLYEDTTEMNPEQALYMYGTITDTKYYAFIDNQSPKLTDATAGEIRDQERDGDNLSLGSYTNQKPLILLLYRADHIFNTNQIINTVLSKATVTDAIVYFLQKMKLKDVLMSPAQNTTVYPQLIIPPLTGTWGLERLAQTYSIHHAGTTFFFDYDMIYILNKKLGCTAWINNEFKTTYLTSFPKKSETSVMKSGFYPNGKEKYSVINIIGNTISISDESMFNDQLLGGNVVSIDSNTGAVATYKSKMKVAANSQSRKDAFNRVVVHDSGSNTNAQDKALMEQSVHTLNIIAQDVNIRALSPNKDFIFTTDNDKYKEATGHYRIINSSAVFTKESSMYTVLVTASFVGGSQNI